MRSLIFRPTIGVAVILQVKRLICPLKAYRVGKLARLSYGRQIHTETVATAILRQTSVRLVKKLSSRFCPAVSLKNIFVGKMTGAETYTAREFARVAFS